VALCICPGYQWIAIKSGRCRQWMWCKPSIVMPCA